MFCFASVFIESALVEWANIILVDFTGSDVLPRRFTGSPHPILLIPASCRARQCQLLPGTHLPAGQ